MFNSTAQHSMFILDRAQLKYFICIVLMCFIVSSKVFAGADELNYDAAQVPGVDFCGANYNFQTQEIEYSKLDINGALPYIRKYQSAQSPNLNRTLDLILKGKSQVGWIDNYSNYLIIDASINGNIKTGANIAYRLRLLGETNDRYYFGKTQTDIRRIYSSAPDRHEEALAAGKDPSYLGLDKSGQNSTDHRGVNLTIKQGGFSTGLSSLAFTVNDHGTLYEFVYVKNINTNQAWYKVRSVRYPDGKVLGLSYDAYGYLKGVADNRGHTLTIKRDFVNSARPDEENKSVVTSVVSNVLDNAIDHQTATYTYKAYDWKDYRNNNNLVKLYALTTAESTINPKENYSYALMGNLNYYNNKGYYSTSIYYVPVLETVKNVSNIEQIHWRFKYYTSSSGSYGVITGSYQPLATGNVNDFTWTHSGRLGDTTVYNDTFTQLHTPALTALKLTTTSSSSSPLVTYTLNSNTCATYNGKPVKEYQVNAIYGYINYIIDARDVKTAFTYDGKDRLATVTEAVGITGKQRVTSYTYTTLTGGSANIYNTPNTINSPGLSITNEINSRGQITKQTKSSPLDGSNIQVSIYEYYEDSSKPNYGLLQKYDGARSTDSTDTGRVLDDAINYTYDSYGNLATETSKIQYYDSNTSKSYTKTYSDYTSAGSPRYINHPDGTTDFYDYDARLNVKEHRKGATANIANVSLVQRVIYHFNDLNQLDWQTDENGKTTSFTYDDIGRLIKKVRPGGNYEATTYHQNNQTKSVLTYASTGAIVQQLYNDLDANGRIAKIRRVDNIATFGLTLAKEYDANGNVQSTTTAMGEVNSWTYDELNHVKTHKEPNGFVDTKEFTDNADNENKTIAANGYGSERWFKNGNVLAAEQNASYGRKDYYHDLADNVVKRVHKNRACNYNHIDQLGRMQELNCIDSTLPSNSNLNVKQKFVYDQTFNGRLYRVYPQSGIGAQTDYTYDTIGRVRGKQQLSTTLYRMLGGQQGGTADFLTLIYDYKPNSSYLYGMTLPSKNVVSYAYATDTRDQVTDVSLNGKPLIRGIQYDATGKLKAWNWGNSTASFLINYDGYGLATSVKSSVPSGALTLDIAYSAYDNDGRLNQQDVAGVGGFSYKYYRGGILHTESAYGITSSYNYDRNKNRARKINNSNVYDVVLPENEAYGYIGNNLNTWYVGSTVIPVTWMVGTGEMSIVDSSSKFTISYDATGKRRYEATTATNTGESIWIDYNHKNERVLRTGTKTTVQYMYDEESHLIGEYDLYGKMIVEYIWLGDRPIAVLYPNNRVVYIVTDQQKKPRVGVDAATNQVVWQWHPDAFGIKQPVETGAEINLRFPGQYYDKPTGLYYNLNRYYDPKLGRYWEPDPLGLEAGLNPYVYAENDPVNNVDPTGLLTYKDEARPDTCYARPLETRNYAIAGQSMPRQEINPCPTGNCFTDRIASTFASDLATALPFTAAARGLSLFSKVETVGQYSLGKAAGAGFLVGSGLDIGSQFISNGNSFSNFNYQENIGVGTMGALTSIYGTSLANKAGVVPVTMLNLPKNLSNPAGLVIFGNQFMINQAGAQTVKSATNR